MPNTPLAARDVERIARDVLTRAGFHVSTVNAHDVPDGWGLVMVDSTGRVLRCEIVKGPPAHIRASITRWIGEAPIDLESPQ